MLLLLLLLLACFLLACLLLLLLLVMVMVLKILRERNISFRLLPIDRRVSTSRQKSSKGSSKGKGERMFLRGR